MTRIKAEMLTSLKTLNITYATPQETLLGTPETLPTSEPADPQISYTVQASDLPTFSFTPILKTFIGHVYGAGKFVTAGTLSWRMLKNGVSVATGTASVSANYYYTVNSNFLGVVAGDVLALKLWSSVSDSNWDYKALFVDVTRVKPIKERLLYLCNFASMTVMVLTLGSPSIDASYSIRACHCDDYLATFFSAAKLYESLYAKDTYGIFRLDRGDYTASNSAEVTTNATYRPRYRRNWLPAQITMRGIKL
jgi:hypothetical protein